MGTLQQQDDRTKRGLEVPSLLLNNNNISTDLSPRSYGTQSAGSSQDPLIIPSSDFTIPTSNVSPYTPETLHGPLLDDSNHNGRRGVFGNRVQTKYNVVTNPKTTTTTTKTTTTTNNNNNNNVVTPKGTKYPVSLFSKQESQMSDLSPGPVTPKSRKRDILSPPPPHGFPLSSPRRSSSAGAAVGTTTNSGQGTLYMQSFLLGIAFMAIWSPQNVMAPNLTAMAKDFGFTPSQRDLYLGANIALATGVLSLPISAGIGILADIWNRKYLFVGTVACGGLASLATGLCRSYAWLFLARFINGGCMSGSVPIAFSLLGDLFDTNERNAASSGLTAMMGLGIIMGQVYAGMVGPSLGWWEPFYASSILTLTSALLVLLFVQEPIRGGKEEVLQDMLRQGTKYDRKLTWGGFIHAIRHNRSNVILMWQGFFSSIPWGIIFVFLNDYLSVNRGFSVQDATLLVAVFGIGCACGGMLGGYWGQILQSRNRSYLPLFMSFTTFVGIFPFLLLLDSSFSHAGFLAITYSFLGGCIESLPSVNVRPCLINVNPPETRGAALTAANLIINLARGIGPSFITLMAAIWGADRQVSFNVTLAFFWIVTSIQLLFLARTLPEDQDAMDSELAEYAASAVKAAHQGRLLDDGGSLISIEDRMTSFDAIGAHESIIFVGNAFREIGDEIRTIKHFSCVDQEETIPEDDFEEADAADAREEQRLLWIRQQHEDSLPRDWNDSLIVRDGALVSSRTDFPDENTPLV